MKTKKKKVGAPRGAVRNPKGINQWQDIRAKKPIAVRLLQEQDTAIRKIAQEEGKTLTQIMEEAIAMYLEGRRYGDAAFCPKPVS
jgi:hypothetical protein